MHEGTLRPQRASSLVDQNMLPYEEEWDIMVPGQRQFSVVSWIDHALSKAADRGLLTAAVEANMTGLLVTTRSAAADLQNPTLYDMPLPYVHSLTIMTKLLIMVYAVFFGTMTVDSSGERSTLWIVISGLFTCYFNYALQGLLDLQILLHNPFVEGQFAVPHEAASGGLKKLADGLLAQADRHCLNNDCEWVCKDECKGGGDVEPMTMTMGQDLKL